MTQIIPNYLITSINSSVLAHVKEKSAHSDVVDALIESVKPLGDIQMFCPDLNEYRYVIVSTNGVIFGFAIGMNTIAFRLDERFKSRALITGGMACPECGDDWISFILFRNDWPKIDLQFWALKAYAHARETKAER
jgi:hypothetical protein